ncbi:hypothetical protein BV326_01428 [Pseudomonas syringae pv. actinidiae]|uniref:hypothetical protein n=1 Tax=Pseudomonas syringae TaxID=317 RepID=UPI000A24CFA1|nr:hypothetical protein [Pseudomonas syringae]OSR73972.1 hypothetical protein BV326_01428 [Pseudomonas syringae pv. actinidiae]
MKDLATFSQNYSGIIGAIFAICVALISLYNYISIKRAEERGRRYDRYHQLLANLNANSNGDAPFVDRQVAVVYEMRNFPEYYPVSVRIIEKSISRWKYLYDLSLSPVAIVAHAQPNTLYLEAKITLEYIKRKQSNSPYGLIAPEDR